MGGRVAAPTQLQNVDEDERTEPLARCKQDLVDIVFDFRKVWVGEGGSTPVCKAWAKMKTYVFLFLATVLMCDKDKGDYNIKVILAITV